jgi:D-sedoheptulose 7-phosphate isomerase
MGRAEDIALGIDPMGDDPAVLNGLQAAAERGLLAIALTGNDGGALALAALDFCFIVPARERAVIQETHETTYHVLWELVHVFFEHQGLLEDTQPARTPVGHGIGANHDG